MGPVELVLLLAALRSLDFCYGASRIKSFSCCKHNPQSLCENGNAAIGNDVTLLCETEGDPPSSIQIHRLRDQKPLVTSRGSEQSLAYSIKSVTCDSTGIYRCITDNQQKQTTGLMLRDCPPLSCQDNTLNMTLFVDVNESLNFSLCILVRDLEDINTQTIFINNFAVKKYNLNSNWTWNYQITNSTTNCITNITIMVALSQVTTADYGDLSIEVLSKTGLTSPAYKVVVVVRPRGPPECPTELNITDYGVDHIRLSWRPGLDGGHSQFYHVYFSQDNVTWYMYDLTERQASTNITRLSEKTDYSFKVVPSNILRSVVNSSICENIIFLPTALAPDVENQPSRKITTSIYLPQVMIIVGAVVFTVVLSIKKEKKLREKERETRKGKRSTNLEL